MDNTSGSFTKGGDEGITFGVELEFLVKRKVAEARACDVTNEHYSKLRQIADRLVHSAPHLPIAGECSHGSVVEVCAVCRGAQQDERVTGMRIFTPANPRYTRNGVTEYLYFFLKREWLSSPRGSLDFGEWYPFEISSPILPIQELVSGLPKINSVVAALRNMNLLITAHAACGLHIHVGLGRNMTPLIARKVVTLVMMLETALLFKLCPRQRHTVPQYWSPIMVNSVFAAEGREAVNAGKTKPTPEMFKYFPYLLKEIKPGEWNDGDPAQWFCMLCQVWKAEDDVDVMVGLQNSSQGKNSLFYASREDRDMAQEVTHIGDKTKEDGSPSTMEFRYPPMSFDMDYIRLWTELACRIMEIATFDERAFKEEVTKLMDVLSKPNPSSGGQGDVWKSLLVELGLGHHVGELEYMMELWEEGIPVSLLDEDGFLTPEQE